MHQVEYDGDNYRRGVLPLEDEGEEEYLNALKADLEKSREALGDITALAYPNGLYTEISEVYLAQNGVDTTFTTVWGNNELVKGIPQTTRLLSRITVEENMTGDMLVEYVINAK